MKCEKHNVEMEWRGDLRTGAMHCDMCANGSIRLHSADRGAELTINDFKKGFCNPGLPPGADSLNAAKARINMAERMLQRYGNHYAQECPYCKGADPRATGDGTTCQRQYNIDGDFINRSLGGYP